MKESDQLKIAVFSPSSPPEPEKTEKGLAIIRESRLDIRQAPEHSPSPFPYLAGDDQCQAEAFTRLMQDPEIDVLWAARGGYGISRWIDMVEWDQIDDPPLVTGFSDLTFLHAALSKKNINSIHGPMVSTLPETSDSARHAILRCLSSGHFPVLSGRPLSGGLASGRLIGGNLTCLAHLLCTDSEPPWGNAILLLEEHNEAPYRIDRMLTQLLQAGRLERLTGIAIGQICSEDSPDLINSLLKDRFKSLTFPVLTGLPVGHRPDNFPLLLGSEYILDCDAGLLLPA